jgi:hypothetical protein
MTGNDAGVKREARLSSSPDFKAAPDGKTGFPTED